MVDLSGSSQGARLIFVGGAARSGTTLVQNILDSHPDICGAPELHHLPDIVQLRQTLHHSIRAEWIDLICSYDEVDRCIGSLIENLLLPLADKHGCQFLSEKTPDNILVFSDLLNLFPEAHFIHVVRDPRAVIASMLQVRKRAKKTGWKTHAFTHSVSAAMSYVNRCLNAGFASHQLAPDRVLAVAYEKLVSNPESETKRICRFLQIEWSKRMLHPGSVKHLGEKAILNNIWYDTKSYYRDPETGEIDKWRSQLTLAQQVIIAAAFRDHVDLAPFGYDFSIHGFLGAGLGTLAQFARHVRRRTLAGMPRSWIKAR